MPAKNRDFPPVTAQAPRLLTLDGVSERLGGMPTGRTLRDYAKQPGFPAPKRERPRMYSFTDVEKWVAKNNGLNGQTVTGTEASNAKVEKIKLDLERARYDFEIQRGEYIHRKKLAETFEPLVANLRADLQKEFEDKLPGQYKGRTRAECQQLNAAAVDRIIAAIRAGAAPLVVTAPAVPPTRTERSA